MDHTSPQDPHTGTKIRYNLCCDTRYIFACETPLSDTPPLTQAAPHPQAAHRAGPRLGIMGNLESSTCGCDPEASKQERRTFQHGEDDSPFAGKAVAGVDKEGATRATRAPRAPRTTQRGAPHFAPSPPDAAAHARQAPPDASAPTPGVERLLPGLRHHPHSAGPDDRAPPHGPFTPNPDRDATAHRSSVGFADDTAAPARHGAVRRPLPCSRTPPAAVVTRPCTCRCTERRTHIKRRSGRRPYGINMGVRRAARALCGSRKRPFRRANSPSWSRCWSGRRRSCSRLPWRPCSGCSSAGLSAHRQAPRVALAGTSNRLNKIAP